MSEERASLAKILFTTGGIVVVGLLFVCCGFGGYFLLTYTGEGHVTLRSRLPTRPIAHGTPIPAKMSAPIKPGDPFNAGAPGDFQHQMTIETIRRTKDGKCNLVLSLRIEGPGINQSVGVSSFRMHELRIAPSRETQGPPIFPPSTGISQSDLEVCNVVVPQGPPYSNPLDFAATTSFLAPEKLNVTIHYHFSFATSAYANGWGKGKLEVVIPPAGEGDDASKK